MNEHIELNVLRQFVQGELSEDDSVVVALHLDACHHCSGHAERLDLFAEEFRSMPDLRIPDGLAQAAVLEARQHAPIARSDVFVGIGLLVAAALLLLVAGDPLSVGVLLSVLAKSAWVGAGHIVGSTLIVGGGMLASTVVACGLAAFAVRANREGNIA